MLCYAVLCDALKCLETRASTDRIMCRPLPFPLPLQGFPAISCALPAAVVRPELHAPAVSRHGPHALGWLMGSHMPQAALSEGLSSPGLP